jgi:diphthamide synthase (EF-2-diphthine--ammonia ligase)
MRLAALVSGGKDSLYAAYLAMQAGNKLSYIVSVLSDNPDSYMFHVPNAHLVKIQAELMRIPFVQVRTKGEKEKELEDLKTTLAGLSRNVKDAASKNGNAVCPRCGSKFSCKPEGNCWCKSASLKLPLSPKAGACFCPACLRELAGIDGIVTGAIASEYQKSRIDKIAQELGLQSLAPLWHREPVELLQSMLKDRFEMIITAVAAEGLGESWLGRHLDSDSIGEFIELSKKYRFSPVGEGGEFESLVLDCPLFSKRIKVSESHKKWDSSSRSGVLEIKNVELVEK